MSKGQSYRDYTQKVFEYTDNVILEEINYVLRIL